MEEKKIIEPPHMSRFYTKTSEYRKPDQPENTWSYTTVEIFDKEQGDIKIGEYIRNYSNHGDTTFFPFKRKDGQWFALYSEKYHATYVMSLPECKKIAECTSGRPGCCDSSGFCPVQYWVPFLSAWEMTWGDNFPDKPAKEILWHDSEEDGEIDTPYDEIEWFHTNIAFVYGCYWGGTYDIGMFDLSKLNEGTIIFSMPFNPCELPRKIKSKNFSSVIETTINDNGSLSGVSVLGKYYSFRPDNSNIIMTEDEENELYQKMVDLHEQQKKEQKALEKNSDVV